MKFKKSILLPLVLSIVGVLFAVITFIMVQFANKTDSYIFGPDVLAIYFIVLFVLFLSALSAKKPTFTKVLVIISISLMLLGLFITAIACSAVFNMNAAVTWDTFSFLAISVLCFVAGILFLIYYLIAKKDTLLKLAFILNIVLLIFLVGFAGIVFASSFAGILKTTKASGLPAKTIFILIFLLPLQQFLPQS